MNKKQDYRAKVHELEGVILQMRNDRFNRDEYYTDQIRLMTDERNGWRDHALMLGRALAKAV